MSTFAQQVAELIHAEAQSGSAMWDELNGPSAVFARAGDGRYTITIPQEYGDEGPDMNGDFCVITIEHVSRS